MTNYEIIQQMSLDAMAKLFAVEGNCVFCKYYTGHTCTDNCLEGVTEWLNSEVEE